MKKILAGVLGLLIALSSFAAPLNGVAVLVDTETLCNNGVIEKSFAGGFLTTCGAGWVVGALPTEGEVIFDENFDDNDDWKTLGRNTLGTIPAGWDAGRTDENWHPDDGDVGTQPSMQINGNDPNQVYGGTGKAWITSSESVNDLSNNGFTSDGILTKDITPTDEIYIKFKLKFQTGWAANAEQGQIKLVRFGHLDAGGDRYAFFSGGDNAPILIYDWSQNDFGVRHFHAFRCDAQTVTYLCTTPVILNPPRAISSGDMSANYVEDIAGVGAVIPDQEFGGDIPLAGTVYHNQVWGDIWQDVEIYAKQNSAVGVQDGLYKVWLGGVLIIDMDEIPWIGSGGDMNALWNNFSIGGNDRYHWDLVGLPVDRERWYAIDNIVVRNGLPAEHL